LDNYTILEELVENMEEQPAATEKRAVKSKSNNKRWGNNLHELSRIIEWEGDEALGWLGFGYNWFGGGNLGDKSC
jgi:hypothetical protein